MVQCDRTVEQRARVTACALDDVQLQLVILVEVLKESLVD
jgi:hypothetical protein